MWPFQCSSHRGRTDAISWKSWLLHQRDTGKVFILSHTIVESVKTNQFTLQKMKCLFFYFVWQHVIMDTRFCFTLTERNKIVIPLLLIIIHIFLVTHSISTPPSSCTGAQNSHSSWEVCRGLHMVCGHHSKPHPIGWRLRQWRSVVSDHTDCHQQTRCPRICC